VPRSCLRCRSAADAAKADHGFDVRLLGQVRYDVSQKAITRFDMVAVGDTGASRTSRAAPRPGRTPARPSPSSWPAAIVRGARAAGKGHGGWKGYWRADK